MIMKDDKDKGRLYGAQEIESKGTRVLYTVCPYVASILCALV